VKKNSFVIPCAIAMITKCYCSAAAVLVQLLLLLLMMMIMFSNTQNVA